MKKRTVAFCVPFARVSHPQSRSNVKRAVDTANPLTELSERVSRLRCPFWRRRATDVLDAAAMVLRWAASRHASLRLPALSVGAARDVRFGPALPMHVRVERIRGDFERKQYYVTGRVSRELYHPSCVFDGPDPDTPVVGTEKWCAATAGLFDQRASRVDLLYIQIVDQSTVRASWRIEGKLALPWKPSIKPFVGDTIYRFDERGLVRSHFERWSISALDAFVSVVFPSFGAQPAPPLDVCLQSSKEDLDATIVLS